MKKTKSSNKYVAAHEQRQRDLGRTQRKRWALPEHWPLIDKYIKKMHGKEND